MSLYTEKTVEVPVLKKILKVVFLGSYLFLLNDHSTVKYQGFSVLYEKPMYIEN